MKFIDARGQNCPIPVVMAKKAFQEGEKIIKITVDNQTATKNLEKLAQNNGMEYACTPVGADFEVTMGGTLAESAPEDAVVHQGNWALFVTDKAIGQAPNELGETLVKMYFYTLAQGDKLPGVCLFMNEGVKLLENPEIVQSFNELEAKGVKLIFCGACLNFYGISDLCKPENISNMYVIIEEMAKYGKVVKL